MCLLLGCTTDNGQVQKTPQAASYAKANLGDADALIFDPSEIDPSALPDLRDLPYPSHLRTEKKVRAYKGIIKNKTRYDLSVPSGNSGAVLIVPAKGWIEYTAWSRKFDLTAYRDGKPFYCLKIYADPKNYQFMCQRYDFIAEIVKEEPVPKRKPVPKKKIKKKDKGEEVEGLG